MSMTGVCPDAIDYIIESLILMDLLRKLVFMTAIETMYINCPTDI